MAKTSDWTESDKGTGRIADRKKSTTRKRIGPKILFPTEPSTIGDEKIARAIDAVLARKKQQS
ncbi:MAG TPA: hypothetical protein VE974_03575 [Thermoanaerobaculia bacterium]|nr:hypothetical protein [Thermoanaerobaculia bacterium]